MISCLDHSVLHQSSPTSCNWFWSISAFLGTWEKTYWALWETIWCRGKDVVGFLQKFVLWYFIWLISIQSIWIVPKIHVVWTLNLFIVFSFFLLDIYLHIFYFLLYEKKPVFTNQRWRTSPQFMKLLIMRNSLKVQFDV